MKPSVWLFAAAMSVSSLALAQSSAVHEITDPAKIAEIERHAQELASGSQQTTTTTTNAMGEQEHMRDHGARHHHKMRAKHRRAMKEKAAADQPMATEAK
jgi:hypothetical protein